MLPVEIDENRSDSATEFANQPHWASDGLESHRPALSEDIRNRMLYDWNHTCTDFPGACAHELFEQQVARDPDAIAVVSSSGNLTYRELNRCANQIAHYLLKRGVSTEDLVGICLTRSPEMVAALLGVWKSGAAYVPLDPSYPQERLSFMAADAELRILVTEERCKRLVPFPPERTVCLDSDWAVIGEECVDNPKTEAMTSNLAYVIYTSGSTGKPKGAMILHSGLVNYLWWAIQAYRVRAGGSVPVHSSISFDLTVTSLYPALLAGAQVELLAEDFGAQNLIAALRDKKNRQLVKITPAHLEILSQQLRPEEMAGMTNAFVIGGENLTAESLRQWREFAPSTRLINEYGPTETVVGCCVYEVQEEDPQNGSVPIGRPIANTCLYILDENLEPVPPGVIGELFIGGAGVARGYLNRPEQTKERFLADPFSRQDDARMYRSGDLARYRSDGIIEYLGRVDGQVKISGYRIELGEIEAALASCPAVQSSVVLAREDPPGERQLVGYVVLRVGETPGVNALQNFLRTSLPEYMIPARWVYLESLPLTSNGKIDRKALPVPSNENLRPGGGNCPPDTETEKALAAIWKEVLRIESLSIHDDFFDLGGRSLLAIKVISRIRDVFSADLSVQTLFENSTIAALAEILAKSERTPETTERRIKPRRDSGPAPMSASQQPFWYLHQLNPGSPVYNIMDLIRIEGSYNRDALNRAVRELTRRHEILRTRFGKSGEQTVQFVLPEIEVPVPELDWTALSEQGRECAWKDLVQEEGRKPFDLSHPPLLRATIVHCTPKEHLLFLTIHHILADEWSMEIIQGELHQIYRAFSQGQPSPLAELPIQYADYATWQRGWLQGQILQERLSYWKRELAGASFTLELPTDKPRPANQSFKGSTETFVLSAELLHRLKLITRQEQVTLFMTLEASFAAFLHRYTNQDDILVGTPISNRAPNETEELVGCFLNTVVLRTKFAGQLNFRSLLRQVRERSLGAFAHSDAPFDQVVAELAPQRDASRSPLFQVMFVLHAPGGMSQVSKAMGNHKLENGTSKFDLTFTLSESEDGLQGVIEYSTDLFTPDTIRRMSGNYATMLQAMACEPGQDIDALQLLSNSERRQLLIAWNNTATAYPQECAHRRFEKRAVETPNAVAVVFENASLTYADLNRRANQLAHYLRELGVKPDAPVAICVERGFELVVALLAVFKAGGAYVPLDPAYPVDRLNFMIQDSAPVALLTEGPLKVRFANSGVSLPILDLKTATPEWSDQPEVNLDVESIGLMPSHLAYVIYTSGSTGKPKGVEIPHSALANLLFSMQREPGFSAGETMLAVTTPCFDIAGLEIYLPLIIGGRVVIASREDTQDPTRLMKRMQECRCTMMQATPSTWRALIQAGWTGSSGLRVLCGGEALPRDLVQALLPRCAELWNMYGPTETTIWSTLHRVTSATGAIPIGKPIANTQLYVLTPQRVLTPLGTVGELYIGGSGLARGYLHREELTRERFVSNPFVPGMRLYRTGDLARWLPDGTVECLGRVDNQVKIRGFRIELGEIENRLAEHPAVREAVVVPREGTPGDMRLVVFYTPSSNSPLNSESKEVAVSALRAHLAASLPEYMIPSAYVRLDALPMTPNGKVDRRALPDSDAVYSARGYEPPHGETETKLAAVWSDVLKVERVGRHDNFFDLGGHSLLAVRLMLRLQEIIPGEALPLRAVLEAPTVESFATWLDSRQDDPYDFLVPMRPGTSARPPFFCVHGAGGNVLSMRALAKAMDDDLPFYCFQAKGLDGSGPFETVEETARCYVDEIRRVQPRGPYHLGGGCYGGIVAFEMACLLEQMGERVATLILMDAFNPAFGRSLSKRELVSRHLGFFSTRVALHSRKMVALQPRELLSSLGGRLKALRVHLLSFAAAAGNLASDRVALSSQRLTIESAEGTRLGQILERVDLASRIASSSFVPKPFHGDIVIFRASVRRVTPYEDDLLGWKHCALGTIKCVEIKGTHDSIFEDPAVRLIARKIEEILHEPSARKEEKTA